MFDDIEIPEELATQIGELAQSPLTFAEGLLLNPEDLTPFEANPPQQQIMSAQQRDVWFCLVGNSKILHPHTLRPTRIEDCYGVQETVVFDFQANEVVWSDALWIKQPAKKLCQKFKFASGVHLSLSTDHQVFSRTRGWVEACELTVGDQVLAPAAIPVFGKQNISRLEAANLAEKTNFDQRFPDQVFQLSEQGLRHFLAEYWMIQGRLFPDKEIVIFFTNNRDMAEDLHHLLLKFGVDSIIDEDNNLFIVDPIDLPIFLNVIGIAAPILDVRAKRRWEIVSEVRKIGYHEVYDLSVQHPDTNFIANDVVVHNCVHRRAGKAQPLHAIVYTPDGPKTMGEMEVGMSVCTPDGGRAVVTDVFPQGTRPTCWVFFDDGTSVETDEDHLWEVYTSIGWKGPAGHSRKQYGTKVLSSKEIAETLTYEYSDRKEFRYKLNPIKPVSFNPCPVSIDPYTLGVLLGDGHMPTRTVTSADKEILDRIQQAGITFKVRESTKHQNAPCYFLETKALKGQLDELGLSDTNSHTKFIPTNYLFNTVEIRLAVLQGLMDTDGSSDKRRKGQAEFCTVSVKLAQQTADLARSLGCKVRVTQSEAAYTKNGVRKVTGQRFRLNIRVPEGLEIFGLKRKQCGGLPERYLRRTIVAVDRLSDRPTQCISIDHPDHLYLTDFYLPTHNSFCLVILAMWHAMTRSNRKITLFAPSQIQVDEFFKTLDLFFNTNPLVKAAQAPVGNTKAPYQIRTFITGSTITGFPLGVTGGAQEGKRGVGSDVIIVDEAHLLTEEDWRVVNPIMRGDFYRQGRIRCYIAGTIVEQTGWFYKKIFELPETKTSKVLKIPITENHQWTEEMVADIKANTPEHEWLTEWMLQPTSANTAVFRMEDIDRSCHDYAYHCPREGVDLINNYETRYLTVDWDKYQAGTNICVTQYDPGTQMLKLIYRTEIPRSQFTYMEACQAVLDLFVEYQPSLILTDQGAGEMQWEYLVIEGDKSGLDFSSKTIKVAYQSVIEVPDIEDPANGMVKKQMKHFLIGLLARRFQENKIIIPYDDIDLRNQLYMYKVLKQTKSQPIFGTQERSAKAKGPTYTSKNEHIIDCLAFACLGAYLEWENVLDPHDQLSQVHRMSTAPSEPVQLVGQSALWAELDGISPDQYDFGPLRHYMHRSSF